MTEENKNLAQIKLTGFDPEENRLRRNHRRAIVREFSEGLRMWVKEFRGEDLSTYEMTTLSMLRNMEPWKHALVNPSENEEINSSLAAEYENAAWVVDQLLVSKHDPE